eukprot:1156129-Pelagomonas_calceolata.AAC.10
MAYVKSHLDASAANLIVDSFTPMQKYLSAFNVMYPTRLHFLKLEGERIIISHHNGKLSRYQLALLIVQHRPGSTVLPRSL